MASSKIDLKSAYEKQDLLWRAIIWDPQKTNDKAPCTISIKNGEPIEVECWEVLEVFDHFFESLNFHEPLDYLEGETEEGKSFTIHNLVLEAYKSGPGIPLVKIIGEYLIHGVRIHPKRREIKGLSFRLQYLDEWLNINPVSIKSPENNDKRNYTINVQIPEQLILVKSKEYQVSIGHWFSFPYQDVNRLKVYPIPYISILFQNNANLFESVLLRDAIYLLIKNLIGVDTRITESKINIGDELVHDLYFFDNKITWSYQIFSKRNILLEINVILPYLENVIPTWIEIYSENQEAIKEYYRISSSRDFVNKRELFINATQGIEMFFKIFSPKIEIETHFPNGEKKGEFSKKIEKFTVLVDPIISEIIPDNQMFIKRVVKTRNHYAHYNLNSTKNDFDIIPLRSLGLYTKRLEIIISFSILVQLGIPVELLVEGFKKNLNYFILKDEKRLLA